MQFYTDISREEETYSLPDAEVFYVSENDEMTDEEGNPLEPGYYYWSCFPGCLPDSDPSGPYDTEQEAIEAARDE